MKILGIDPSTKNLGWGLIHSNLKHINHGVLRAKSKILAERLSALFINLQSLIKNIKPDIVAIEQSFIGNNMSTGLILGSAYGMILTSIGLYNIKHDVIPTRLVKKIVSGNGGAQKDTIRLKVASILGIEINDLDASDALATAIAYSLAKLHPR